MNKRDIEIIKNLQRFRALTRDHIIDLHFSNLKNKINSCNTVLKRLRRDGYIDVSTSQHPYIYFPSPSSIKKDSAKIPHFLSIAQFYTSLLKFEKPKVFIVEPKYGKGFMEPDCFMIWKGSPFFVEIQRSIYSKNVMSSKFQRYILYYQSNEWKQENWQPEGKTVFPRVLIISDTRYELPNSDIRFFQTQNIEDFLSSLNRNKIIENKNKANENQKKLLDNEVRVRNSCLKLKKEI